MEDKIKKDIQEIQDFKSDSIAEIEEFRIKFLGKKGLINSYFVEFKSLDSSEKKNAGRLLNELKTLAQDKVEALKASSSKSSENIKINDISRPGDPINIGSRHPISVVKNRIIDRFGDVPNESEDLINSVKLKWVARNIGFEKIVLKNKKMICYFISDKNHEYFKSDIFISVLKTINENPGCKLKEKNKLYVVFENINSINEALKNLNIF